MVPPISKSEILPSAAAIKRLCCRTLYDRTMERASELDTSFPISFSRAERRRPRRGFDWRRARTGRHTGGIVRSGEDLLSGGLVLSGEVDADFALAPAAPRSPRRRPRPVPPSRLVLPGVGRVLSLRRVPFRIPPLAAVAERVLSLVPCRWLLWPAASPGCWPL
jgi:hypothetical protein